MLKRKITITAVLLVLFSIIFILPPSATYAEESSYTEIIMTFGGDVTFGDYKGLQEEFFEVFNYDYSVIFSNVYDIFSNDDLTLVNLETTLTDAENSLDKTYAFKAPYEYVNILTQGSIEAVSIANNHARDYLDQGRFDTVRTLMENDIIVAGENYVGSVEIKGVKIAILGYVTFQTPYDYESAMERDIPYMKKTHDIVIVSMHWGNELVFTTKKSDINLGHKIIDLGADLVVGHHPHNIKGIEHYNGKYIVYSLGNCSFAGNDNPTEDDMILFQQKFIKTEQSVVPAEAKVIPCRIRSLETIEGTETFDSNDFRPTPYEGDDVAKVLEMILEYSADMEYGLVELPEGWIQDPYTRDEYRADKEAEKAASNEED